MKTLEQKRNELCRKLTDPKDVIAVWNLIDMAQKKERERIDRGKIGPVYDGSKVILGNTKNEPHYLIPASVFTPKEREP